MDDPGEVNPNFNFRYGDNTNVLCNFNPAPPPSLAEQAKRFRNTVTHTFVPKYTPNMRLLTIQPNMANFDIRVSATELGAEFTVRWNGQMPPANFGIFSQLNDKNKVVKLIVKKDDLRKLPHEVCCLTLFGEFNSDVKVTDVFPEYNGFQKRKSPDQLFLVRMDGDRILESDHNQPGPKIALVCDMATSNSHKPITDFELKSKKYDLALTDIKSQVGARYQLMDYITSAVVVTNTKIFTNLILEAREVQSLVLSKKLGDLLFDIADRANLVPQSQEDYEEKLDLERQIDELQVVCESYIRGLPDTHTNISTEFREKLKRMADNPAFTRQAINVFWPPTAQEFLKQTRLNPLELCRKRVEELFERNRLVREGSSLPDGETDESLATKGLPPRLKGTGTEVRNKAFSVLPAFKFKSKPYSLDDDQEAFMKASSQIPEGSLQPMMRLWKSALDGKPNHPDVLRVHEEHHNTKEFKKKFNANRNEHGRVKVEMDEETRVHIAKDGVQAKKLVEDVKHIEVIEHQKLSKRVYSFEHDCSHITRCIEHSFWDFFMVPVAQIQDLWTDAREKLDRLDEINDEVFGKDSFKESKKFVRRIEKTQFGQWLFVVGRILEELNLSLSQFVQEDSFVLKRIDDLPVFLLIKPTSIDGHIFFSILIDSSEHELETLNDGFREMKRQGNLYYTEFVSLKKHKLGHLIGALHRLIPFLAMWMEDDDIPLSHVKGLLTPMASDQANQDVKMNFSFTVAVFFEGKTKTSADLQLARYAYMEAAKASPLTIDPLKVLSKADEKTHSLLHVWAIQRMIRAFTAMSIHRPKTLLRDRAPAKVESSVEEDTNQTSDELLDDEDNSAEDDDLIDDDRDILTEDRESVANFVKMSRQSSAITRFSGLINFVSMKEVSKFSKVLNLSYFSHVHNKEDSERNQGEFKIFAKVGQEELKLRKTDTTKTFSDEVKQSYDNHEFSAQMGINCGHALRRYLTKVIGPNFESIIERQFIQELNGKTSESLATTKSSAVRSKVPMIHIQFAMTAVKEEIQGGKGKRRKVLEGILEVLTMMGSSARVYADTHKLFVKLISLTGTYAILFRKEQIGGTREIFILDILSRLVIHFLETYCRVVCNHIEHEMLTKGDLKLVRSTEHYEKISRHLNIPNREVMTAIDSGDCTTWAQRFVMGVFSSILEPISSPKIKLCLDTVLNLQANKMLELPEFLLQSWISMPDVRSVDPVMQEMKDQFLGRSEHNDLLAAGSRMLKNKSNMMQGILHFTSSLAHAAYRLLCQEVNKNIVQTYLSGLMKPGTYAFIRTDKVSSDDFSVLRSIILEMSSVDVAFAKHVLSVRGVLPQGLDDDKAIVELYKKLVKQVCVVLLGRLPMLEAKMMNMLTMAQSDQKSTIGAFNYIEEFNSMWILSNSIMTPRIKFVYGATFMKPLSNFYNRLNTMFDLRKQMIENGCSLLLSAITQECQKVLHYMTLGLTTMRKDFPEFADLLRQKPSVSYGFFATEPERLSGILGFDFIHYILCRDSLTYSRSEYVNFCKNGFEFNENGLASIKTYLLMGQAKKYQEFLMKLRKLYPDDWRAKIEEDPFVLYKRSQTKEESILKIMKKAHTPGMADAFSFLSANKAYSASVYVLIFPTVTRKEISEPNIRIEDIDMSDIKPGMPKDIWDLERQARYDRANEGVKIYKQSLIGILRDLKVTDASFKDDELLIMFPSRAFYDEVYNLITELNSRNVERRTGAEPISRFVIMSIPKVTTMAPVPLLEAAKKVWFGDRGIKSKYTDSDVSYSWAIFQERFKWLGDTPQQSLGGPITTQIALYEFLSSLNPLKRSFKVLSYGRKKATLISTLLSIAKFSFDKSCLLKKTAGSISHMNKDMSIVMDCRNDLTIIKDTPCVQWEKKELMFRTLDVHSRKLNLLKTTLDNQPRAVDQRLRPLLILMAWAEWQSRRNNGDELPEQKLPRKLNWDGKSPDLVKNFSDVVTVIKGGLLSRFTTAQHYNSQAGKYEGPGKLSVVIDDSVMEVFIVDNRVSLIVCNSIERLKHKTLILSEVLSDIGLSTSRDAKDEPDNISAWFNMFSKRVTMSPMEGCSPVREVKSLEPEHTSFSDEDLYMSYDPTGIIRLKLKVKRAESSEGLKIKMDVTVASWSIRDSGAEQLSATEESLDRWALFLKESTGGMFNNKKRFSLIEGLCFKFLSNEEAGMTDIDNFVTALSLETVPLQNELIRLESVESENEADKTRLQTLIKENKNLLSKYMRPRTELREALLQRIEQFDKRSEKKLEFEPVNLRHVRKLLLDQAKTGVSTFKDVESLSSIGTILPETEHKLRQMEKRAKESEVALAELSKGYDDFEMGLEIENETRVDLSDVVFTQDEGFGKSDVDILQDVPATTVFDLSEAISSMISQDKDFKEMVGRMERRPYAYYCRTFDRLINYLSSSTAKIKILIKHLLWSPEQVSDSIIEEYVELAYSTTKSDLVKNYIRVTKLMALIFLNDMKTNRLSDESMLMLSLNNLRESSRLRETDDFLDD